MTENAENPWNPDRRVAVFVADLSGRGVQRVTMNLATELDRQGVGVDLVLTKAEGAFLSEVPETIRVVDLGASRAITALPALTRYLWRERPEAMISAEDHSNVIALLARRVARYPKRIAVSTHVPPALWAASPPVWTKSYLHRQLIRKTYPAATARIAVSGGLADEMSEVFGLRSESVEVLYNPVVTPALMAAAKGPAPHSWLAADCPPVILGVGSLTPHKGFDILIKAFAELRRERPARLMILGEGRERKRLVGMAAELGIGEDFCLAGFVNDPIRYMTWADLFVLSSRFEGFGLVLVEAMACGCPVVSTDCRSGPSEILESGLHGPLVPVEDVGALASAMRERMSAPRNSGALRKRAEYFSVERIVARYREILGI